MYDHYTLRLPFSEVRENEAFVHKTRFGQYVLYRKVRIRKMGGSKYNAELVKKGLNNYRWFDDKTQVRIIR